jgi:hypothetical protein
MNNVQQISISIFVPEIQPLSDLKGGLGTPPSLLFSTTIINMTSVNLWIWHPNAEIIETHVPPFFLRNSGSANY